VLKSFELEGKPATLYVLAPEGWDRWAEIPNTYVVK
jgi:hypothetical protein